MGDERSPATTREPDARLARPLEEPAPSVAARELEWERALRILEKNWRLAAVFAVAVVVTVTLVTFKLPAIYEPTARLEIDLPGSDEFSLKDSLVARQDDQDYLRTQVEILKSDGLAVATVRTLRLDRIPELAGRAESGLPDNAGPEVSASQLTPLESRALRKFRQQLRVSEMPGSRLVEVSFASRDARLAAQVTNTLVNLFIDRNYRTRYEAALQASDWLTGQLSDLREKVEKSNQALADYQRRNGLVDLEPQANTASLKLADLNHQLAEAQAARIQLEAELQIANRGGADSLPESLKDPLLQALAERLADARGRLAQALAVYGPKNANVVKLESEVGELQSELDSARAGQLTQLRARYAAAAAREQMTAQALEAMKRLVSTLNEKLADYNVMRNEAKTNSDLYNALLARLKEASISAGLKSNNIRVVDRARVLDRPTRPNRPLDIALGLCLAVLGGLALAFLKETLSHRVRTPDDIREWTGLPSLALLPQAGSLNGNSSRHRPPVAAAKLLGNGRPAGIDGGRTGEAGTLFLARPRSPEAEALRSLRTSLMLSRPGTPPRVTLVVSPSPREGKTTIAINLAIAFAQHGSTCLVDADLRRPAVARNLRTSSEIGLSNVLTGSADLETALNGPGEIPNLTVLPAGPLPPNPGDLVSSEQMRDVIERLRQRFDYVMIDSPPIIPFADARALSSYSDGVVLVGRSGLTTRQALVRALEILNGIHAPILGVVLNGINLKSPDYHYYHYGYQRHGEARFYRAIYEDDEPSDGRAKN